MSKMEDAACGALSLIVLAVARSALLSLVGQNKWLPLHPELFDVYKRGAE